MSQTIPVYDGLSFALADSPKNMTAGQGAVISTTG